MKGCATWSTKNVLFRTHVNVVVAGHRRSHLQYLNAKLADITPLSYAVFSHFCHQQF